MKNTVDSPVRVVGAGLAGCEAAWQLAERGIGVVLHEMRPVRATDVHKTDNLAELVCSNSFRSDDAQGNAVGVLHREMRALGSLILATADKHRVPAGGALAVDREGFSTAITETLEAHPLITIAREEIDDLGALGDGPVIVATGPLTSDALSQSIRALSGTDHLAFFDAIAPIVYKDSIDFSKVWYQSRYDKGDAKDYINCPLDKAQYDAFIDALVNGEKTTFKEWEANTPYFEGCLPIEVMAERGPQTLSYGPMKPVGLTNPHAPTTKAHAIVQLRQDNALGTLWNMVGFQTKLTYGEQKRIFRTIPGLENAAFARLGGIHRNTFIKSPVLLDNTLRLKNRPNIRFAGQITGCEGYVESASIGLLAGMFAAAEIRRVSCPPPPKETALGALLGHITTDAESETFQPMNVNFGLFPPIEAEGGENGEKKRRLKGRDRKLALSSRAEIALMRWIEKNRVHPGAS
ncbi:methylenetetrahydrofolate--tRNA-(uracil(54)-C(5))-methyltransferase (FADH(2)-oxidizing) TrmFO [Varunaivibrio sulfuroxidans]|uniref:Methylenetetrahydrofolate--tRNA-(uracil-5-)-methyltransferase TrmFO n=1 Tax=Varunaivibrio sulfuroxidans TaxID=1773489 RepID=A0A4R3J8Q4_9PROT|nr:methylenetetrahydrofolate--tRNA-(uracil-5-)-methyltransferase [Varunaivibrio sulfuroxidans]WES31081.1 methylenetetrahydrofolate--tRNA-(uracil(54)-C(5))-methyltransferase (FADH(2)-oxidizing) TrmFO [Varunaivibrio sulfuroxidans]